MSENWKDIEGYEGVYQISSMGRVRRIQRRYDSVKSKKAISRILKPKIVGTGYRQVCLCWHGKHDYRAIHRLVAKAFLPNPQDKLEVNHKNGDKADNREVNLEWVTRSENKIHAARVLGLGIGETNPGAKLDREQAKEIRIMVESGSYYFSEIAEQFGVSEATISNIATGATWSHLGPPIERRKPFRGPSPKLDQEKAEQIRQLYEPGKIRLVDLAAQFNVSKSLVSLVIRGEAW